MKSRTVKYQILVWTLVFLCIAHLVLAFVLPPVNSTAGSDLELEQNTQPPNDVDAGVTGGIDSEEEEKIPTNAIKLINYALDILNNGKGSKSTYQLGVYCVGTVAGYSAMPIRCKLNQHSVGNLYNCGDQSLQEDWFYYDGIEPLDLRGIMEDALIKYHGIRRGYRAINVDKSVDQVNVVETEVGNYINRTYDLADGTAGKSVYTYADAFDRYVNLSAEDFNLPINEKTVKVVKRMDNAFNNQYVDITVEYNLNKLPDNYSDYYHANGSLDKVKYSSYTYTFTISKKTGRLSKIYCEQKFDSLKIASNGIFTLGININAKAVFTRSFQSMDTEVEIPQKYLEYKK